MLYLTLKMKVEILKANDDVLRNLRLKIKEGFRNMLFKLKFQGKMNRGASVNGWWKKVYDK